MITLIADGSHDHKARLCGYCCWIQPGRWRLRGSKLNVGGSVDAEMLAILEGLKFINERFKEPDSVIIQSDCIEAYKTLEKRALDNVFWQTQHEIEFRHIRGHTREERNRNIAQAICDQISRSEMRRLRKGWIHNKDLSHHLAIQLVPSGETTGKG